MLLMFSLFEVSKLNSIFQRSKSQINCFFDVNYYPIIIIALSGSNAILAKHVPS